MPGVRDKHKFQVAAQHPLHSSLVDGKLPRAPQTKASQPGGEAWVPVVQTPPGCWKHTEQNDQGVESQHSAFTTRFLMLGPPSKLAPRPLPSPVPQMVC